MRTLLLAFALLLAKLAQGAPADPYKDVRVESRAVSGSVYMLTGAGGNLAVSIGHDGTLLVDDQFKPLAPKILAAIEALRGTPPRIVLNTHFHGDHTGGNPVFGRDGVIIAHENVRLRLLSEDLARSGLPLLTFADRIRVHFNDDEVEIIHMPNGHTDGDVIVWFKTANVLHMGDHFFNGRFPYIDVDAGGSIDGYLANVSRVLAMVPADIRIIPGHGALASVVELAEFRDMIERTRDSVRARLDNGATIDEVVADGLEPRDAAFDGGFITQEAWIRTIDASIRPQAPGDTRGRR
jgi:glyoxylase-like metal-dependent hydrolase (beta-lactamase superfamily II)